MGPLIIIFGWRSVTYSAGSGSFCCPHCQADRYTHKRIRRFFTLYFVPLVPLDLLDEYAECSQCKQAYHLDAILDQAPPATPDPQYAAEVDGVLRRALARIALAIPDAGEPQQVATVQSGYQEATGEQLSDEDARGELRRARQVGGDLYAYLSDLRPLIDDHHKRALASTAALAASNSTAEQIAQQLIYTVDTSLGLATTATEVPLARIS